MATKAVGKLWVGLDLKTNGFQAGLKKGEKETKKSAEKMKGIFKGVFSGAFLGTLAAKGFSMIVAEVKKTVDKVFAEFERIDQLKSIADRFDIDTEALIGFQHAAESTGSNASELNTALETMAINLGQAESNAGPAVAALKQMRISASAFNGMSVDEQFNAVADAISNLATQQQKAAAASQIFGGSGVKLLKMLDAGSEGLKRYSDEAKSLGISFTSQQAMMASEVNKMMKDLNKSMNAFYTRLAFDIGPLLRVIVGDLTKLYSADGSGGEPSGLVSFLEGLTDTIYLVGQAMRYVFGVLQIAIGDLLDKIDMLSGGAAGLSETAADILAKGKANMEGAIDSFLGKTPSEQAEINRQIAAQKAAQKGDGSGKPDLPLPAAVAKPATALLEGSVEAQSAINEFLIGGDSKEEVQDEIAKNTAAAVAEQKESRRAAGQTAEEAERGRKKDFKALQKTIRDTAPQTATIGV